MIGIIGGSGMYDPEILKDAREIEAKNKFGIPSDKIIVGKLKGKEVAFIARHGKGHRFNPTNIPARANIWALKELGVTHIISPSAVGSLREDIKPGDFVITDQFIDHTKKRVQTFYDEEGTVCHISMAEPMCGNLRKTIINKAKEMNLPVHGKGTYVCIEGPRFSTKAESRLFRSWGADVIGMTIVPEAVLAREVGICYANIAMATDYDCFSDDRPAVTTDEILAVLSKNVGNVKKLLSEVIIEIPAKKHCNCAEEFEKAVISK